MTSILRSWSFPRLIRAGVAILIFFEMWRSEEWFLAIPGAFFAMQAYFNTTCCGANGCDIR